MVKGQRMHCGRSVIAVFVPGSQPRQVVTSKHGQTAHGLHSCAKAMSGCGVLRALAAAALGGSCYDC